MNRSDLVAAIRAKKSMLCVGLDTDPANLPTHLSSKEDGVLEFNKAIIDATREFAVSYKLNTAFYEAQGIRGWEILEETRAYIGPDCLTIADAKRGDIGNTAQQYAKTFFQTYPFDAVTIAPYMGKDSVAPFLEFSGKWGIVLGLTSNKGNADFQMLKTEAGEKVFEVVLRKTAGWGTPENLMFVVGATDPDGLRHIRNLLPEHFFLVPGVGAQGGSLADVSRAGLTATGGLLVNASRSILYASDGPDFAERARAEAQTLQTEMAGYLANVAAND